MDFHHQAGEYARRTQHTPAKGGGLMSVTASKAVGLITLIFDSAQPLGRY